MTPAELLESVKGLVWLLSYRLAERHRLDPEELFQSAAVRVLRAARRYDPAKSKPCTFAGWQVRGAVSDLARREAKHRRGNPTAGEVLDTLPARADAEPAEPVPYSRHLAAALDTLPDRDRAVLLARHGFDGDEPKTLKEIGDALGVTRERVRQIEVRAIARLRTAILDIAHPTHPTAA